MKNWLSAKKIIVTILVCLTWVLLFSASLALDEKSFIWFLIAIAPGLTLGLYLFYDPENFLFLTIFFVPLSIKLEIPGGFAVAFPSEIMAVLLLGYIILNFKALKIEDRRIFSHPIFLLLIVYFAWMIISSALSEFPLVSFKHSFIQALYLVVFYFIFLTKFNKTENIVKFFLFYSLGLIIPIINGFIWHSQYNFNPQASYYMPQPFFIEHTIYGAAIAFTLPMMIYLFFFQNNYILPKSRKWGIGILLILTVLAEFLAFSRAAWLSIIVLPFILLIIKLKIRQGFLLLGSLILLLIVFLNLDPFLDLINKNESRSNRGNIKEQIESVSNIHTDISNLERINRWQCAIRMFKDRPLTGYGPGTYQFVYGRFQIKNEMTRISTYHGEKGNAHSEYLGFLAESGFPGLLIYIVLIITVISTILKIIYKTHDVQLRRLATVILLSLLTFYFHTIFNGFLETDKIGSLYYGSLAAITALDVYFFRKAI